jgi:hypothetical protein
MRPGGHGLAARGGGVSGCILRRPPHALPTCIAIAACTTLALSSCRTSCKPSRKRGLAHWHKHCFVGHTITDRLPRRAEFQEVMSVTTGDAVAPELSARGSLSRVIYGSCLCGEVGYRISGSPLRMVSCHCESCRLARSAAHASNLFVPARQFRWTRGESQVVSYRLPGPAAFATAFCRRCGSDLPHISRGESAVVVPEMPPVV